jgi:hypothetical protein
MPQFNPSIQKSLLCPNCEIGFGNQSVLLHGYVEGGNGFRRYFVFLTCGNCNQTELHILPEEYEPENPNEWSEYDDFEV